MESSSSSPSNLWRSFAQGSPGVDSLDFSPPDFNAQTATPFELAAHNVYRRQATNEIPFRRSSGQVKQLAPKRIIICCDGTWQSSVTGQKNIPSNVTRLARSISRTGSIKKGEQDSVCRQVVFYSSGIGASGGVSIIENARQALFGDGLNAEVIKAYNFVVMNYAEGDEVFCFGFSRGAYTARAVAGLITDIGIIEPQEMDDFPDLYKLYQKHSQDDSSNFRQSRDYREWITGILKEGYENVPSSGKMEDHWRRLPHTLPPELSRVVQVVGVFDTVGALGIPDWYYLQKTLNYVAQRVPILGIDYQGFHNTSMSKYIKYAFHALALDEHIRPFKPTLWHLPQEKEQRSFPDQPEKSIEQLENDFRKLIERGSTATEETLSTAWSDLIKAEMAAQLQDAKPDLRQVWFPGGHVNIGGGNPAILKGFTFDFEQLALISFTWMCDQIRPLLQLDDIQEADEQEKLTASSSLADREIKLREKMIYRAKQHKNFGSWPLRLFWRGLDYTGFYDASVVKNFDEPDDSWATGPALDIFDVLNAFFILKIIVFFMKAIPFLSTYRKPGECINDTTQEGVGKTNEQIHPSVTYRLNKCKTYRPNSLKGFTRSKKKKQEDGKLPYLYEWTKGEVTIPEYVIKSTDFISRRLAQRSSAKEFVDFLVEKGEGVDST